MDLQVIGCQVAFRLPLPVETRSGDRLQITLTSPEGEKRTILDVSIPLMFDALVLVDPASWQKIANHLGD